MRNGASNHGAVIFCSATGSTDSACDKSAFSVALGDPLFGDGRWLGLTAWVDSLESTQVKSWLKYEILTLLQINESEDLSWVFLSTVHTQVVLDLSPNIWLKLCKTSTLEETDIDDVWKQGQDLLASLGRRPSLCTHVKLAASPLSLSLTQSPTLHYSK